MIFNQSFLYISDEFRRGAYPLGTVYSADDGVAQIQLFLGAGDGHIQTPLPAVAIQWAEIHGHPTGFTRPITDGKENHVATRPVDS